MFAVKGGRFITHMRRLRDAAGPLANFFASGVLALGPKLGPVLWQLPPALAFDPDLLVAFFDLLPRTTTAAAALARRHDARLAGRVLTRTDADRPVRHTLEVRHSSFADDAFCALAAEHGIGVLFADTAGRWPLLTAVTSDVVHVRLHGHGQLHVGGYDDAALATWAERVHAWRQQADVFVYFDNDTLARAPGDAERFARFFGPSSLRIA